MRYLPDVNVWLAFALSGHPFHDVAKQWLDGVDKDDTVLMCRSVQQSLLRLLTTAAVFRPLGTEPLSNDEAWAISDAFADDPRVLVAPVEPPGIAPSWRSHSMLTTASPKRWMDAYLAAFAYAGQYTLVTTDRDFDSYDTCALIILTRS